MLLKSTAWLESEEYMCDRRTMEDRYLTVAVLRRMILCSQLSQLRMQIKRVALPGETLHGGRTQPILLGSVIGDVHRIPSG